MPEEEIPFHVLIDCESLVELRKVILGADMGVNINIEAATFRQGGGPKNINGSSQARGTMRYAEHPDKPNKLTKLIL